MAEVNVEVTTKRTLAAFIQRCHCGPLGVAIHPGAECPNPEVIDLGIISQTGGVSQPAQPKMRRGLFGLVK